MLRYSLLLLGLLLCVLLSLADPLPADTEDFDLDPYIRGLYRRYLRRAASNQEVRDWIAAFDRVGSLRNMTVNVLASEEYFRLCKNSPERFVRHLYEEVLEREPDPKGRAGWLRAYDNEYRGDRIRMVGDFLDAAAAEMVNRPPNAKLPDAVNARGRLLTACRQLRKSVVRELKGEAEKRGLARAENLEASSLHLVLALERPKASKERKWEEYRATKWALISAEKFMQAHKRAAPDSLRHLADARRHLRTIETSLPPRR